MSKKTETADVQPQQQSDDLARLMLDGTITICAATREEVNAKALDIIAEAGPQPISAGAVGEDHVNGCFVIRLDIIK